MLINGGNYLGSYINFIKKLKEWNVDSRPMFYPISTMPMFETQNNKNAGYISDNGINLPSGHNLSEDDIDYICNVIKRNFNYFIIKFG